MNTLSKIPTLNDLKDLTNCKSIFFDMDGTLVDTEPLHARALQDTLKHFNSTKKISKDELMTRYNGLADNFVFEDLKSFINVNLAQFLDIKNSLFLELLKDSEPLIEDKILNLLNELKSNGYTLALITASEKVAALTLLKKEGIDTYFDLILTRDDCSETKPNPMPYLEALRLLDIKREEAFIFEDSEAGIQAALGSGIPYRAVNWF